MFERRVLAIHIEPGDVLDSHGEDGGCTATDCKKTCRGSQSTGGIIVREDNHIRLELDPRTIMEFLRGGQTGA